MKKTVKKFLSMLLVLLMVLSILPTAVFATEQTTVAAPLDSLVPYGANDQITGTATIHVRDPVTFTGYSAFENVPYYLVTLPAGTTYVKATYQDAALLTNATSGEASGYYADVQQWTGGGVEMAYTESDGAITITIPMNYSHTAEDGTTVQKSFVLGADGSGNAFAPEYDSSASYAPVHFLAFEYASKSAPTVASGAITTANVILGNAWTLDVAEMFTDADDDALTYTATVNGAAQTLNGSTLSYTPAAAGEYTIVLTATDDSGTATHTIVLTAAEGPQVPRLKNGVPDTASATVSVGYAYNLSDLQAGNIFENPDGSSLSYTDYYYYRTVGTGERKGPYYFSTALFGATTIQITENTAGTYVYEFHAMNSAGLSTDTWTLTLTVSDEIEQHYTFHVGRDMNYSTNGNRYPLIKLYKTAGRDDEGADYLASYEGADGKTHYIYEDYNESITRVDDNYEISVDGQTYDLVGYSPLTLKASDFTTDDPDSTGTLADNYNNFYASLPAGRYSFRAYGYETSTGSANVYLGGHSLTLPTETNVDGGTGGGTDYKTNVAQYQQMDQAKLELTIPTNVDFGSGSTADVPLTNGYTYGSMYSAANPFATLYNMTDTGVGTNFNAVTVNFCLNRFPDVNVTVVPRYTFKLKMNITNPTTATPTVTLTDAAGNVYTANSSFEFEDLPYGTYTYTVSCAGCNYAYGSFYLGSADKADISSGMLTKDITLTASTTGAWDGVTLTQPTLTDGVYQIGTGAELAWFANQVNSGSSSIRAVLTADIDLAYYNWTPIAQTTSNTFAGSFDGQGHTVNNFGIYYNTTGTGVLYKGLFGDIYGSSSSYAVVKNVKVNGEMFLSSTGNVSNAYVGGITGGARYTTFTNVESDVDISITRVGGNWSYVAGVAGYSYGSTFTNCGNSGDIHGYQYVGGITGYATDAITGCYNGGAITGNGYVGGIVGQTTKGVTACYNTCSITGASNYVAGIVAYASGASASVKNCYNRAYVESTGSYVGAVVGMTNNASAAMENLYYLDFTCTQGIGSAKSTAQTATAKTRAEMAAADFVTTMNTDMAGTFGSSRYSPALSWQTDLIGLVTPTKGNVNLDPFGYVDEEDLTLLTQWAAERKTSADLTAEQWAQADINGDGVLDRNDTTALRRYVNNPSEYPLR